MRLRQPLCLLLALLVAAPAAAGDAQALLKKMAHAARALDYHGTLVFAHGQALESMRIAHQAAPGGERERIEFLTGEPREILRDRGRVACLLPRQSTLLDVADTEHPLSLARLAGQSALAAHYQFHVEGEDRVAGRPTRIIAVQPKDQLRYGYRLWLDAEHGLLLKSALLASDGQWLEQMMFTSVHFETPASLPELDGATLQSRAEKAAPGGSLRLATGSSAAPAYAAQRLPPGFALVSSASQQVADGQRTLHRLVYSDGLATISVYVEPAAGAGQALHGATHKGGVRAFGTPLGAMHVTALGEAPPAAVEMVARSVVPLEP